MRLLLLLLATASVAVAQQHSSVTQPRTSPWFNAQALDFAALFPPPPQHGSAADRQDMQEVLLTQRTRTPGQIQQAQADDKEEDIFVFATVLGPAFNAAEMPSTAALSQHLREASAVINPSLKARFARPRPFVTSKAVQPVCEKAATNSYPSGHSMVGTLEAMALTQIIPERSPEVLARLDQGLHNRIVCGVHYPSDVAASRGIAASLFGLIAASPAFQQELAAAKTEVRAHLGLAVGSSSNTEDLNFLGNNTVLIVRHAEKPDDSLGQTGLTTFGQHRADAYVRYFQPFRNAGLNLRVSALYSGADSASSIRPRLTLEPLSRAAGLALDTTISTKDPAGLVALLRGSPHGTTPLICWRHGQIPALLSAFGVAPHLLLPNGTWPDDVYDWVLVLHFDAQGRVSSQQLVHESLPVR